jgi:SOS-response transcriptional repressor LexA
MNISSRIESRMRDLGLTQDALAKRAGVSQTTIFKLLSGKAAQTRKIVEIAKALGVTPEWLATGLGAKVPLTKDEIIKGLRLSPASDAQSENLVFLRSAMLDKNTEPGPSMKGMIPVISWVEAGQFCNSPDLLHPGDFEDLIPCPRKAGKHSYALRVQGDSMVSPFPGQRSYPPGAVIICDPEAQITNGCRVVARIHDEETATFKVYAEDAGKRYLKPLNPQYPTIEMTPDMHICGVVVGSWMDE